MNESGFVCDGFYESSFSNFGDSQRTLLSFIIFNFLFFQFMFGSSILVHISKSYVKKKYKFHN